MIVTRECEHVESTNEESTEQLTLQKENVTNDEERKRRDGIK